jgi:hypothetical protein
MDLMRYLEEMRRFKEEHGYTTPPSGNPNAANRKKRDGFGRWNARSRCPYRGPGARAIHPQEAP